jgi:hypothetical protein
LPYSGRLISQSVFIFDNKFWVNNCMLGVGIHFCLWPSLITNPLCNNVITKIDNDN